MTQDKKPSAPFAQAAAATLIGTAGLLQLYIGLTNHTALNIAACALHLLAASLLAHKAIKSYKNSPNTPSQL